jgi:uncharacterized coiled-coil protein SlyX
LNSTESTPRLDRLEASIAHLERQLDELNAVAVAQGKLLTRLQKRLELLGDTVESQELDRVRGNSQRPPHWMP